MKKKLKAPAIPPRPRKPVKPNEPPVLSIQRVELYRGVEPIETKDFPSDAIVELEQETATTSWAPSDSYDYNDFYERAELVVYQRVELPNPAREAYPGLLAKWEEQMVVYEAAMREWNANTLPHRKELDEAKRQLKVYQKKVLELSRGM